MRWQEQLTDIEGSLDYFGEKKTYVENADCE